MMLAQMRLVLDISDDALRKLITQKFEKLNDYLNKESDIGGRNNVL